DAAVVAADERRAGPEPAPRVPGVGDERLPVAHRELVGRRAGRPGVLDAVGPRLVPPRGPQQAADGSEGLDLRLAYEAPDGVAWPGIRLFELGEVLDRRQLERGDVLVDPLGSLGGITPERQGHGQAEEGRQQWVADRT